MTGNSNEPRESLAPGVRESSAVAAAPTIAHASDNARRDLHSVETDETAAIRDYWAAAKRLYQRGGYADYGSPEWCALPLEDPRKMAGLVAFAQLWLKYGDEIADDLNRQLQAPYELWQRATPEACAKAFHDMAAQHQRRKEAA